MCAVSRKTIREESEFSKDIPFSDLPEKLQATVLHNILSPDVEFVSMEDCINSLLGRVLSLIRASTGDSQQKMAEALGLSQTVVSRIESAPLDVKMSAVREYCRHLRQPLPELLDWAEREARGRELQRKVPAPNRRNS